MLLHDQVILDAFNDFPKRDLNGLSIKRNNMTVDMCIAFCNTTVKVRERLKSTPSKPMTKNSEENNRPIKPMDMQCIVSSCILSSCGLVQQGGCASRCKYVTSHSPFCTFYFYNKCLTRKYFSMEMKVKITENNFRNEDSQRRTNVNYYTFCC